MLHLPWCPHSTRLQPADTAAKHGCHAERYSCKAVCNTEVLDKERSCNCNAEHHACKNWYRPPLKQSLECWSEVTGTGKGKGCAWAKSSEKAVAKAFVDVVAKAAVKTVKGKCKKSCSRHLEKTSLQKFTQKLEQLHV
jgi:hypothetical protein